MQQNVQKMANLLVEGGLSDITSPAFQKLQTEMTRKVSRKEAGGGGLKPLACCWLTVLLNGVLTRVIQCRAEAAQPPVCSRQASLCAICLCLGARVLQSLDPAQF